jgi:hypothetical protein
MLGYEHAQRPPLNGFVQTADHLAIFGLSGFEVGLLETEHRTALFPNTSSMVASLDRKVDRAPFSTRRLG